jgi:hypothetical protein
MPKLGEERHDVYLLAAENLKPGHMLRRMMRPHWGVKKATGRKDWNAGVALEGVKKGKGLWVRVSGTVQILKRGF